MTTDRRAHRLGALRDRIRAVLEGERRQVHEEIRAYPTPIPRCDQQFNHLIERRELLAAELARLDATAGAGAPVPDGGASLDAFISSSACLAPDFKLQLQALLHEGLDAPALP
jgi:hypothetical protein